MTAKVYRAKRILTMNPQQPMIADGALVVVAGRIAAVGDFKELRGSGPVTDLGPVSLGPGLINSHVHLGLSHLGGRIAPGCGFFRWAEQLFALLSEPLDLAALDLVVASMRRAGTAYVGEIAGRDGLAAAQALERWDMGGHFFREYSGHRRSGLRAPEPLPGTWSLAVHALYSTSGSLAQAAKGWCREHNQPFSLHLAEVPGENELLLSGQGPLADFARRARILPGDFVAPGLSATALASQLGLLDERTLAVHCVHVGKKDIDMLAASRASVCLCPRSNAWIGVGQAPVARLWAAGVPLCLGTDSVASNEDMDLWAELRAVRLLLPAETKLSELLKLVTVNPARVFGVEDDLGSLHVGKLARWAILPPDFGALE